MTEDSHRLYRAAERVSWWTVVASALAVFSFFVVLHGNALSGNVRAQEAQPDRPRDLIQAHDNSNFPLVGRHRTVECSECHLQGVMAGTPRECEACHWTRRQDDRYRLQLGVHCENCHTPWSWKQLVGGRWNHEVETGYRLEGSHQVLECGACHGDSGFAATTAECGSCHIEDHRSVREPDHVAAGFPTQCEICHLSSTSWTSGIIFDHSFYPLSGQHQAAACGDCHRNGSFAGTSTDCAACHMEDFNGTSNPNHQQAGFPTDCEVCHGASSSSWQGATTFEHGRVFPLNGQHRGAECNDCHVGGQYAGTSSDCVSCHREDYNQTTGPNHQQAGFPTDCETCHGDSAGTWVGATTEHRRFPLKGRHQSADCGQCHSGGQYAGLPSNCASCHLGEYQQTNHQQQGFSTDCENCHGDSATTWQGASVDHRQFPLKGKHKTADCSQCHSSGQYAGLASDCVSCHRDDYQRTNHQQQGFSTDCRSCHGDSANSWQGASFDHSRFPLRGSHQSADCSQCHTNGQYAGLPSDCVDCHLENYNRTNHRQVGFSTDCESCHGTSATSWQGANFDHNQFFRLQGAHTSLNCDACHNQGSNPPRDCFGCHANDYNRTRDPDHVAAGFPSNCESCHLPNHVSWTQAVFNHDFPINSGKHRLDCAECHQTSNFRQFSCIHCHDHEKSRMDEKHKEEAGYTYNSQACYSCHTNGRSP